MDICLVMVFILASMATGIFMGRHWDYFISEE